MKTTDYSVLMCPTITELVVAVKTAMASGWQPVGSVSVEREVAQLDGSLRTQYLQAMIRTEQPKARTKHPLSTVEK